MIPIASNHAADVIDGEQLPGFVANVLPAGNLFEDKQAHFVAGIEEMTGLRIMRSAHDVAMEFMAQDAGIAALGAAGHGLADEGKRLMTVEAAELDDFAIELEAVVGELRFAKAERAFVLIDQLRSAKEAHVNGIEIGVRNVPQFDRAEVVEVDGVRHWFGGGFGGRDSLCALGQDMLAIAEFHFEHERFARCFEMLEEAIYVESRMRGENVFGLGENVFNERAGDDSQGNFAIDAAESEVVDLMAERRDVRALGRVHVRSEHVFSAEIDVRRQIEREGRVTAFVFAETRAIDPNCGGGHDAFEVDENMVTGGLGRQLEAATISGDELVGLVVKAVPGQANVGVGNDDAFEAGVVKVEVVRAFEVTFVEAPIAVDRKDHAAFGFGIARERRIASEGASRKRCAGNHLARRLEKVASVHGCPFDRVKEVWCY